ncbi:MAG: ribosome biogenesis GTP-binding protein YihA/YsxC [Rhodospirillales bacterium]
MPPPSPEHAKTDEDARALEEGRRLFAQPAAFVVSAADLDQVPETDLPEVAFAGRSNVGKSSLINALTGQTTLARTSNTPGRTRQINFFTLGRWLMLADLPGFGYARAPKAQIRRWTGLVRDYLRGRAGLRRACLLIDARHGFKDADRDAMALLDKVAVSYQVVLTKCDKLKPEALQRRIDDVRDELAGHPAAHPAVIATSARDGQGTAELRAALAALVAPVKLG